MSTKDLSLQTLNKIQTAMAIIKEKIDLAPMGHPIRISFFTDRKKIAPNDFKSILEKLEADEKIIQIITRSSNPINPIGDFYEISAQHGDTFKSFFLGIEKKITHLTANQHSIAEIAPELASNSEIQLASTVDNNAPSLWITLRSDKCIMLNDEVPLKKPHLESENELIMNYLMQNPNVSITIDHLSKEIKKTINKSPYEIARSLGFHNALYKLFFKTNKSRIIFTNPVSKQRMSELGCGHLTLADFMHNTKSKDL